MSIYENWESDDSSMTHLHCYENEFISLLLISY